MPVFTYKALQRDGTFTEGELEAGGRQEAFRQMEGRGLRPVKLAERNGVNGKNGKHVGQMQREPDLKRLVAKGEGRRGKPEKTQREAQPRSLFW